MEFRILGPLEVANDDRVLALGSGRQLALVAVLLLHRNEVVSVDRLVDDLWDGATPPTAAKIVRNNVSLLRKELGDRLETRPPGYVLRVEEGELDSERLERAVERGDLEALTDTLALWRGTPLSQFAYERFAQAEVARLEELRLAAIEARIDAELALGRHDQLIPELEALARRHPTRERLQGQLMLALYRAGRQADALEAYRRARRALHDELGIEPGAPLRDLERGILNQDESLAAPHGAAKPAPGRTRARPILLVAAGVVLATRRMRRQAGADPMKALATALVTGLLVTGAIAPAATGSSESPQPDAIERLLRQEDARWNDPALGATREWKSVGIVDPWIGARVDGPLTNIPVAPSIAVVDPTDRFDWSDAFVGAAAGAAILAASAGVGLAVRTHGLRQA